MGNCVICVGSDAVDVDADLSSLFHDQGSGESVPASKTKDLLRKEMDELAENVCHVHLFAKLANVLGILSFL